MNQQLSMLIELGELETRLEQLRARRRAIPGELEELKAGLARLRAGIDGKQKELEDVAHERRLIENEVEDERHKLDKHKFQLLQVKTNREYEAMELEIGAGEEKVSGLEDRVLELMERDDELKAALREEKRTLEQKEADLRRRDGELAVEDKSLGETISALEGSAAGLTGRIEEPLYREYRRIRDGKDNHRAIVPLTARGACGGCYSGITLQTANEIRLGDKIITCNNCGRILYYNSSGSEDG